MSAQGNNSKLMQELKVIPRTAWMIAGTLLLFGWRLGMPVALHYMAREQKRGDPPLVGHGLAC